ncbi:NAD-dependent epimerase/dehydratase family protein [Ornithinimicrobium sp. LYQ121]|uniref:NAD-dependent epimerase/dehydratase family protein n=1 Tax=Ornithinimicrobium sp. LYQ121 TaxID=3378801 RepID=UPI003854363B
MRLLITGGAGFIGSNLARLALDHGHHVVIIDDLSTGYRHNVEGLDVDFHEASILDEHALSRAVQDVDAVTHLSALGSVPRSIADPAATHEANATGTLRVIEAVRAAGGPHLTVASSSSVYGMNPAMPKSEREWIRAMSPYAVSKIAAEQYALAAQQSFGLETLAFRFFNVYGPGQMPGHVYAAVIPIFLEHLLQKLPLPINGDGSNSRDFTFVGTVCRTLLDAAVRRVVHTEPVNLAFGTNVSLMALIDEIRRTSGENPSVIHQPPRVGDVPHSQADNATLRSLFPDVEAVPLGEGLRQTLNWFINDLPALRSTDLH